MKVVLLHATPIHVSIRAARKCWDSMDKSDSFWGCFRGWKCNDCECANAISGSCEDAMLITGKKDKQLLQNLIKSGHESVLEHITFNLEVDGVSRALLQELARHRIASYSVQSSRYTLKKMLKNDNLDDFFVKTGNQRVDDLIFDTLLQLKQISKETDLPNDILKYAIPEAYCTTLIVSINVRSLRNFLKLRTSNRALMEIRRFALEIYKQIKDEYGILFEDIMEDTEENNGQLPFIHEHIRTGPQSHKRIV